MADDDGTRYDADDQFYGDEAPDWTEADEERYQARRREEVRRTRRRRRQAASFAAVVLLVLGVGLGAAGIYQGWWEWPLGDDGRATSATDPQACPTPSVTSAPVAEVTVTVLNATETRGLAATVSAEMQARGFTVTEIGNDEADVADTAQVRYGPESALQARTVAVQFPGAVLVDDGRAGTDVELSIGTAFTGMTPPEEAAAALAPVPAESPSGCVTPAPDATPADPATTPPADPAATPTG